MAVYVLTKAAPSGAPFTLEARTTVQFNILGSSQASPGSKVILQLDKGSSVFDSYNIEFDKKEPINVDLAAATYRVVLDTASDTVSYSVSVLPDIA